MNFLKKFTLMALCLVVFGIFVSVYEVHGMEPPRDDEREGSLPKRPKLFQIFARGQQPTQFLQPSPSIIPNSGKTPRVPLSNISNVRDLSNRKNQAAPPAPERNLSNDPIQIRQQTQNLRPLQPFQFNWAGLPLEIQCAIVSLLDKKDLFNFYGAETYSFEVIKNLVRRPSVRKIQINFLSLEDRYLKARAQAQKAQERYGIAVGEVLTLEQRTKELDQIKKEWIHLRREEQTHLFSRLTKKISKIDKKNQLTLQDKKDKAFYQKIKLYTDLQKEGLQTDRTLSQKRTFFLWDISLKELSTAPHSTSLDILRNLELPLWALRIFPLSKNSSHDSNENPTDIKTVEVFKAINDCIVKNSDTLEELEIFRIKLNVFTTEDFFVAMLKEIPKSVLKTLILKEIFTPESDKVFLTALRDEILKMTELETLDVYTGEIIQIPLEAFKETLEPLWRKNSSLPNLISIKFGPIFPEEILRSQEFKNLFVEKRENCLISFDEKNLRA